MHSPRFEYYIVLLEYTVLQIDIYAKLLVHYRTVQLWQLYKYCMDTKVTKLVVTKNWFIRSRGIWYALQNTLIWYITGLPSVWYNKYCEAYYIDLSGKSADDFRRMMLIWRSYNGISSLSLKDKVPVIPPSSTRLQKSYQSTNTDYISPSITRKLFTYYILPTWILNVLPSCIY